MIEEIKQITKNDFLGLSDKEKWNFIETMKKILEDLEVRAEKNCELCEKTTLSSNDINIELFFEDWRNCSDHCNECSKEDQKSMCDLQFNLLNHIANTIINLQNKHNALTRIVLKKDERGSELIDLFKKEYEKKRKVSEQSSSLYQ